MTENIQSWSVCVLCYNEEGAISTVLERLNKFLLQELGQNYEIIIVNDGSTDGSLEEIELLNQNTKTQRSKSSVIRQILVSAWR